MSNEGLLFNMLMKRVPSDIQDTNDPKYTGGFKYEFYTPKEILTKFCRYYDIIL